MTDLVRISSNILFFVELERGEGARYRTVPMETLSNSVADQGCLYRIPDPNFFHPVSASASKEFKYMIREVHPGSGSLFFSFYPSRIPDPGVKKAPDPGSATQIPVPSNQERYLPYKQKLVTKIKIKNKKSTFLYLKFEMVHM